MLAMIYAILTAIAWGVGGYFEKKGLQAGNLTPQVGSFIRTGVALLILSVLSYPQWKEIPQAGFKSLSLMVLGGGVLAGTIGMLCFYAAIKNGQLPRVMPVAFTAPLFGAILAITIDGDPITIKIVIGMLLTVGGIIILSTT
ncbi:EamA-like transporter family protein [Poriferisphaera corsica]|uniref:EamA-like transporter family protein n=1 Tax=Poriferisphaera corsica TaxID=2528020 RepID=A0A517YP44_9BACT|nr:EamA family transporter [Poriferisphaera corsica]QDU31992.1 EamA-like transporter family protein [Poriferisphaera corsica]